MTERAGTATAVPVRLPLPIRALTWEADTTGAGWRWLLPAAAVLEVTRCHMPAPLPLPLPLATASALVRTLLGTVAWRGRRLPLLSLLAHEDDADGAAEPAAGSATMGGIARLRAVVCPCLGADAVTPAFGLAAQGLPSLLMLREGEVEPGDADAAPPFAAAVLRVRGARYVVPDLDALSAVLAPLGGLPD